ncbi:MAG: hypothetical protein RJA35_283 [Actinomycetota bacterium]
MSLNHDLPAEQGVSTPAATVSGLGYPNGRAEVSPTPTGWSASAVTSEGAADQAFATVSTIDLNAANHAAGKN